MRTQAVLISQYLPALVTLSDHMFVNLQLIFTQNCLCFLLHTHMVFSFFYLPLCSAFALIFFSQLKMEGNISNIFMKVCQAIMLANIDSSGPECNLGISIWHICSFKSEFASSYYKFLNFCSFMEVMLFHPLLKSTFILHRFPILPEHGAV